MQNNDCLRSLNNRTQVPLSPNLFIHFSLSLTSWIRPWFFSIRNTTKVTSYIWIFFFTSAPWKGHHTGEKQSSAPQAALKRQVWSAQDTSPFRDSVAGERNCFAGQVCKGLWFSTLFRVYLLLTRYSHWNPTRGWHNATCNVFSQDCGTMVRLWEWAKIHAHKMDYAELCYSAAFEMQRQQLTELTWTDANRNSSSCLAVRETTLWYRVKQ